MELQQQLGEFEAAGIAVFAVSYDPVDALAGFAGEFGILNTLIGADEPVYGIPFPSSYVVDADGRVAEKFSTASTRWARPARRCCTRASISGRSRRLFAR